MSLRVRAAAPDDLAYLHDLGRRTAMVSVSPLRPVPEAHVQRALERLFETIEGQSHVTLVAEREGVRCGFIVVLDELLDEVTSLPQGFIAYLAVEPVWQRSGVGDALLEAAENEARRRGLPYMTLMVTQENAAARALYARRGYATERRLLCKPL